MIRKIIRIDEDKCTGCALCATACHEGAIGMVNGKAKLLRENYCDGFGDCLPACPAGAISFEEREAPAYDENAVLKSKPSVGRLSQWPVQIKLVPVTAPFFKDADLLIAATCSAFAYGAFHEHFIKGRVTLVGCPKLDGVDYADKLSQIFAANDIKSIRLARMQVPCCGGLESAVKRAVAASGKDIPVSVSIISSDGRILN
ncbi:MAG: 4Fe-4S binding protein [Bullifex sp.]|nr:4Fe-4S binding protein [Spirochaetales bacterium]MDY3849330.1 4Fe-4S binding protein [Bullifex sp.]